MAPRPGTTASFPVQESPLPSKSPHWRVSGQDRTPPIHTQYMMNSKKSEDPHKGQSSLSGTLVPPPINPVTLGKLLS